MVQQNRFTSHSSEDPNEHIGRFLRRDNTVKLIGVRPDVIKLQLFPFSLRDKTASCWNHSPMDQWILGMSWLKHSWVDFSLMLSPQREEDKSLYSSKVKMKVSIMPGKGIRSCLRDVQCMGLIR